jgi:glycerol uptake facilitator protein
VEKLFYFGPAIRNYSSNLISEIIGTFVLIFVIFYLAGPDVSIAVAADAKIGFNRLSTRCNTSMGN